MSLRIGVVGATGRMGAEVCRAVEGAPDLELVAAVDVDGVGRPLRQLGVDSDVVVTGGLEQLVTAGVDVAVEFTGPASVGANLVALLEAGVHTVVGATGISPADLERASAIAADGPANALVAPNFAIGAVLLMRFAAEAARHLPHAEIVELHHDRKLDAPSGTALRTAELIARARVDAGIGAMDPGALDGPGGDEAHPGARGALHEHVRIHSIRLPGLVAHQEVVLGGEGQTLSLRHDSLDRASFMPGVLLACRRVADLDGLVVGLEHLL